MQSNIYLKGLFLLIFVSFFQLSYAYTDHGEHGGVKLEISLEKTKYLAGEPIWLNLKATNITDHEIGFLPLELYNTRWFRVIIVRSEKDTLDYLGGRATYGTYLHGKPFAPGELYSNYVNLISPDAQFGKFEDIDRKNPIPLPLKEGAYSIQASYLGNLSNKLQFETTNPIGDEKKAYELLKSGYKYQLRNETIKQSNAKFEQLLERFPYSVYAAEACYELYSNYKMRRLILNIEKAREYAESLISEYSNSGYVKHVMYDLIEDKTGKEKIEWLEGIEKKFPATRAASKAKNMRKNLLKKCQD